MANARNLVVLGTRGTTDALSGVIGSVAADLIRRSTCPVVLVPARMPEDTPDRPIQRVLTYVSYTHVVRPVLIVAAHLARLFGGRLDVLAVMEGAYEGDRAPRDLAVRRSMERQLRRMVELESDGGGEPAGGLHLCTSARYDAEEVLQFATSHASDLLVVASPGLTAGESPLERLTETIVQRAPCPVVLVNTSGSPVVKGISARMVARTPSTA